MELQKAKIVNLILKSSNKIKLVGSYFRNPKNSKDLDFVSTLSTKTIENKFKKYITKINRMGERFISVNFNNIKIDFFIVNNLSFGMNLYRLDKGHQIGLKRKMKLKGFTLNQNGLFKKGLLITNNWKRLVHTENQK